jgi:predicted DNA-binding protein
MPKESRDAVVSVRISEEDQARLRELAAERGTSVSELVRSVVLREVEEAPALAATVTATASTPTARPGQRTTTTSGAQTQDPGHGLFWANQDQEGVVASGGMITLRVRPPS